MRPRYTADAAEPDVPALVRLIHHAFAGPLEGCGTWVRQSGFEHLRLMRGSDTGTPEACLRRIPMGQYFGGRSVPMLGIAGVAVAPESRGRGLARSLMQDSLREAAAEFPISCLYPSTHALYRQVGYEQAGHRFRTTVPVGGIDVRERGAAEAALRPLTEADDAPIRACYAKFAGAFSGSLDRGPYCWGRIRELREARYAGFGVPDATGGLSGYVFLTQERNAKSGYHDLMLSDVAFTTAQAGRRLLAFIADFATTAEDAVFFGAPMHPIVSLMSSRHYTVEKKDYWMLRVLDFPRAIQSRGWRSGVRGDVEFEIADELLPSNAGAWSVRVADGRAQAERTGAARDPIRCDIRAIAPLYSGLYTAAQLALLGWVHGSATAIDAADAIFGGCGTPWMTDMF